MCLTHLRDGKLGLREAEYVAQGHKDTEQQTCDSSPDLSDPTVHALCLQ